MQQAVAIGEISAAKFTTSGQGAGKGGVNAQRGNVTAATSVIVLVHRTDLGPGVPADGASKFPDDVAPAGANSPTIVYPLQGAVMPTSVKPPVVQWEGSGGADHLYRVRVVSGYAVVDTILAETPAFTPLCSRRSIAGRRSRTAPTDSCGLPSSTGTLPPARRAARRSRSA